MLFIEEREHNWRGEQFSAHAKYSYSTVPTHEGTVAGARQSGDESAAVVFGADKSICPKRIAGCADGDWAAVGTGFSREVVSV